MEKYLLFWSITAAFAVLFVLFLLAGIIRRKLRPIYIALVAAGACIISLLFSLYYTGKLLSEEVTTFWRPRSGPEIYKALFGNSLSCVKVNQSQDQLIPRLDNGIFLEAETCPAEVRRLLSQREYEVSHQAFAKDHYPGTPGWFRPGNPGDTLIVLKAACENPGEVQIVLVLRDSTRLFVMDLAD